MLQIRWVSLAIYFQNDDQIARDLAMYGHPGISLPRKPV